MTTEDRGLAALARAIRETFNATKALDAAAILAATPGWRLVPAENDVYEASVEDGAHEVRAGLIASLDGDLLEDFDGAPFPEVVQAAFAVRMEGFVPAAAIDGWTLVPSDEMIGTRALAAALESKQVEIERLRAALDRIAREVNACNSEERWGCWPISLFRVIAEEYAALAPSEP